MASTVSDTDRAFRGAVSDLVNRGRRLLAARPAESITGARLLLVEAHDVVSYAVLKGRSDGLTWGEIATLLNEDVDFVIDHYGAIEHRFQTGQPIGPVIHEIEGQPNLG